jgi:uncharacterized protein (DUF58 family)
VKVEQGQLRVLRTLWPPVIAAAALFVFAAVTHAIWPQLVGCTLVGLVGASLLAVLRRPHIDVRIEMPERVIVGKPFETRLRIRNLAARPTQPLVVRHTWSTASGTRRLIPRHAAFVGVLLGHDEVTVSVARTPVGRGAIEVSRLEIDVLAPFGFFARRGLVVVPRALLVLPALVPAVALPVSAGSRSGVVGRTKGVDIGAVREWRAGDEVRDVQWRSTARTGRLTVLEREEPSTGSLVIVVVGRSGEPAFESAVATAAATGVSALHQGIATVVVTAPPAPAELRCQRIPTDGSLLESLARIERAEPLDRGAVQRALRYATRGGCILLAAGDTASTQWRAELRTAAARAGVQLADLSDTRR